MELTEIKEQFLLNAEGGEYFRDQKAYEYPEDAENNHRASKMNEELKNWLESLPSDHPVFKRYKEFLEVCAEDDSLMEALGEGESDQWRMYGYQIQTTPEDFIWNHLFPAIAREIEIRRED